MEMVSVKLRKDQTYGTSGLVILMCVLLVDQLKFVSQSKVIYDF